MASCSPEVPVAFRPEVFAREAGPSYVLSARLGPNRLGSGARHYNIFWDTVYEHRLYVPTRLLPPAGIVRRQESLEFRDC